jgi:hypothetical protein
VGTTILYGEILLAAAPFSINIPAPPPVPGQHHQGYRFSLNPGGRMSFEVWFAPASRGAFNGAFTIRSSDVAQREAAITLTGTGRRRR